jgi:hypothetical protein
MTKRKKDGKKVGRPQELGIQDLAKRFGDMKAFLENYWGRVGLGLRAARDPEDVRAVLNLVPHIESCIPFRGHAICLIERAATAVSGNELRETRRNFKEADKKAERLWSEYCRASEDAQQATAAVRGAFDGFQMAFTVSPLFFFVIYLLAQTLRVEELVTHSQSLDAAFRKARTERDSLKNALRAQEAWCARNEVVKFARNRRYDKTLLNCARAMAGLPEWGWFHSRRRCEDIQDSNPTATPHLLFQLIATIARKTKLLTMSNMEKKLRRQLLQPDVDLFLKGYVGPQWSYLQEAIQFCRGKGFKRTDLPFKIMDRFLYHVERPKTIAEMELAKRNQLV